MSQPGELSKIVTRGGLVAAFERWEQERAANPLLFKAHRTDPQWMADTLLRCLRQTNNLATLGGPDGGVPGGRPMPGHLHAFGTVVQPPVVPVPPEPQMPPDPFVDPPQGKRKRKGKGKGRKGDDK